MANAREFTPDEFTQRVSDLAAYFQAIMKYRDFTVGAEYFAWSDEWWKNTTADEIIAQIKSKILPPRRVGSLQGARDGLPEISHIS